MWTNKSCISSVQSLSRGELFATPWTCSPPGLSVHHQLPEFTQTHQKKPWLIPSTGHLSPMSLFTKHFWHMSLTHTHTQNRVRSWRTVVIHRWNCMCKGAGGWFDGCKIPSPSGVQSDPLGMWRKEEGGLKKTRIFIFQETVSEQ